MPAWQYPTIRRLDENRAWPGSVKPFEGNGQPPITPVISAMLGFQPEFDVNETLFCAIAMTPVRRRSTSGVSPSAYQDACEVVGAESARVAIACILERAGHKTSGALPARFYGEGATKEFSLGRDADALFRANGIEARRLS